MIVTAGLVIVAALAWAWLVSASLDMYGDMNGLSAWMMQAPWDVHHGVLIFLMWAVMMVAMMLPSAVPTILRFAGVGDGGRAAPARTARAYAFAGGYLLAWTAFSAAATLLQWGLTELRLLSPMMEAASPWLAAGILIAAGVYQWTPLKRTCLAHCHAPSAASLHCDRPGVAGALRSGIEHGVSCIGCCWVLMLLLFAGGVMSLPVIAAIALFVLLEKLLPHGALVGRLAGVALVALGLWVLPT